MKDVYVHPGASVEKTAKMGSGTKVWHYAHVREGAVVGENCIIGHCAYVGKHVKIGNNVKIGNKASIFQGVTIEDDVQVGPHVAFTNDIRPRSFGDWKIIKTLVKKGASIGTNSTVICGVVIGSYSMAGAGSVITRDVPDHGLVYGNPARLMGFVCRCGETLRESGKAEGSVVMVCGKCKEDFRIPEELHTAAGRRI